ncbi:hypothetical protein C0J52_04262 [Blattella germanica]|nr:hypothetical protein C0J52_04262 [Blattella germanica]
MSCCMYLKRSLKSCKMIPVPLLEQFQNCLLVVFFFLRFCENFTWPYTKKVFKIKIQKFIFLLFFVPTICEPNFIKI